MFVFFFFFSLWYVEGKKEEELIPIGAVLVFIASGKEKFTCAVFILYLNNCKEDVYVLQAS